MLLLILLQTAVAAPANYKEGTCCRCMSTTAACWPGNNHFDELNKTVDGRLARVQPTLARCLASPDSDQCESDFGSYGKSPWVLSDQLGSNQNPGNYKLWDAIKDLPAYAVIASAAKHIQAAVRFAEKHKLRLSVKNTGHDWYGRNTAANSLQVWTHRMKSIKFADVTVCGKKFANALEVGAGVQWVEVVPELIERGLYAPYGTSMSVGAAGGYLQGGGFPAVSGEFGSAADNVIHLEVVTADGQLVQATPCSHPDLFWALRGGGGGTFGVVTRAWYQTHESYKNLGFVTINLKFHACVDVDLRTPLRRRFLDFYDKLDKPRWSFVYFQLGFDSVFLLGWWNTYTEAEARAVWEPVFAWEGISQGTAGEYETTFAQFDINPKTGKAYLTKAFIDDKNARPPHSGSSGDPLNWFWIYEVGQSIPIKRWNRVADWAEDVLRLGVPSIKLDGTKALSGKFAWTNETSFNPKFYSSPAMVYTAVNIIPNFHPSLSKDLWPDRCKSSASVDACVEEGAFFLADSDVKTISQCMQASLKEYFPGSGSYINENNPFDEDWQQQQWGANYPALLNVKRRYDPSGLFMCHHCVGSEQYVFTETSRGYCLAEAGDKCPFFYGAGLGSSAPGKPTPPPAPLTWEKCKPKQDKCHYCKKLAAICYEDLTCSLVAGDVLSLFSFGSVKSGEWTGPAAACNEFARPCAPCFESRICLKDRRDYSSEVCYNGTVDFDSAKYRSSSWITHALLLVFLLCSSVLFEYQ